MKFLARMFTVFFARHRPDSTMAKPRFMKNTRNPVSSTQKVSSMTRSAAGSMYPPLMLLLCKPRARRTSLEEGLGLIAYGKRRNIQAFAEPPGFAWQDSFLHSCMEAAGLPTGM